MRYRTAPQLGCDTTGITFSLSYSLWRARPSCEPPPECDPGTDVVLARYARHKRQVRSIPNDPASRLADYSSYVLDACDVIEIWRRPGANRGTISPRRRPIKVAADIVVVCRFENAAERRCKYAKCFGRDDSRRARIEHPSLVPCWDQPPTPPTWGRVQPIPDRPARHTGDFLLAPVPHTSLLRSVSIDKNSRWPSPRTKRSRSNLFIVTKVPGLRSRPFNSDRKRRTKDEIVTNTQRITKMIFLSRTVRQSLIWYSSIDQNKEADFCPARHRVCLTSKHQLPEDLASKRE